MSLTSINNPTTTALNTIGVNAVQVIGKNPGRSQLIFHNPGTVDIFVFPALVLIGGVATILVPGSVLALGGSYRVYANGGDRVITSVSRSFAWLAQAASSSNNPLTVEEYWS